MRKILLIISLLPFAANSQTIVADTVYYVNPAGGWFKTVTYRNQATTSFIPKIDTVALAVTKWKLDSTAAALATFTQNRINDTAAAIRAATASTYVPQIRTVNGQPLSSNVNITTVTGNAGGLSANIAQSQVTNLVNDLAGKQATITVLPFANGGISGSAATSATTGTMTVNMTSSVITITPTGACTFNASGGVAGQTVTFSITTSGTTSFVLTFGTNFRKTGTLTTGTVTARFFTVTFRCINGTIWSEISRTIVQT